jgi:Arc/MetJ-type ribon-helix-helix transcriptional regulator
MNLTVKFDGHVSDVIDRLVETGVVATKTEALRLGVLRLEAEYLKDEELERRFDEKMAKEFADLDERIKTGKIKFYSEKEFYRRMHWKLPEKHRNGALQTDKKR